MERIQLERKLKTDTFNCTICKKQTSLFFNLLTFDKKIICYYCIKNNEELLKSIESSFKDHYEQLFTHVPTPDTKFVKLFMQQLQEMKNNSNLMIEKYKRRLNILSQQIEDFYLQTKIICNGYIDKINLLIEKSQKSIDELVNNLDIIHQSKYINNLKLKQRISLKIQELLKRLTPEAFSINQLLIKEEKQIKKHSICQVPIQSMIEIKGTLYYGTADGRIMYQNSLNGQLKSIKAHQSLIRSLAYDEQYRLYSGSDDFKIKVWDLHGSELKCVNELGTVPNLKSYHRNMVILNKGKTLASTRGQFDQFKIRLWELNTFTNIKQLEGHDNYIRAMTLNSDQQLITVSDDCTLKVWNINFYSCSRIFYHSKKIQNVFCNKQRDIIGIVDEENKILILNNKSLSTVYAWNIGRKILCSFGKNFLYFGVSTSVIVYDWKGLKKNCLSLDNNFLPGLILEIDNIILVSDGKGKVLQIPFKRQ